MKLHDYLNSITAADRKALAEAANIDEKYLVQLKCSSKLGRGRFASIFVCKVFIERSGGKLTIEELRPDIYGGAQAA